MKSLSACLNIDGCVEERFGRCCRGNGMTPGGGLWDVGGIRTFPSVSIVGGQRGNSTVVKGVSVYLPSCPPCFKTMSDIPSPEHIALSVTVIQQCGFCWILLIIWFLSDSTLLENEYRMKASGRGDTSNILGCLYLHISTQM